MKAPISSISVGERHRRDFGDLAGLADSISKQGLLQPIGITEDHRLVFGERRLRACRDILGWSEIEARIVSVTSIVEGEYAENEVRKDFSVSERVAIGRAVEAALGKRLGINQHTPKEGREIIPDPPPQVGLPSKAAAEPREKVPSFSGRTADLAAEKAGFGNRKTYEAAKKVIEQACPGVIEALDKGKVSVAAALVASEQPPEKQKQFVEVSRTEQTRMLREMREAKRGPINELDEIATVGLAFRQVYDARITPERLVAKAFPATLGDLVKHGRKVREFLNAIEKAVTYDRARAG